MASIQRKGAEEARTQLPALLAAAEKGRSTIITRHGRSVAVLSPLADTPTRQATLTPLAGTGKGMWGVDSAKTVQKLRDEWNR